MKLNDFKGFEKELFTKEERKLPKKKKWAKFYRRSEDLFIQPVVPKTIEEYQLDHYAMWMVIHTFRLDHKPSSTAESFIVWASRCYACGYRNRRHVSTCFTDCPLVNGQRTGQCGKAYHIWEKAGRLPLIHIICSYIVAHYKWRRP